MDDQSQKVPCEIFDFSTDSVYHNLVYSIIQVNTLTERAMHEITDILDRVNRDSNVKAAVLISGKKDFILGADIGYTKRISG